MLRPTDSFDALLVRQTVVASQTLHAHVTGHNAHHEHYNHCFQKLIKELDIIQDSCSFTHHYDQLNRLSHCSMLSNVG